MDAREILASDAERVKKRLWLAVFPLRSFATVASLCVKEYIFTQRRKGDAVRPSRDWRGGVLEFWSDPEVTVVAGWFLPA